MSRLLPWVKMIVGKRIACQVKQRLNELEIQFRLIGLHSQMAKGGSMIEK